MFTRRTTFHRFALAALAAVLAVGILSAPAIARPADAVVVPHAAAVTSARTLVAAPTSAASAYRDGYAADATGTRSPVGSPSASEAPWLGIGLGLLGLALIGAGILTLRRHRHHGATGTPSFGA
jgi:hypothetical protein